MQGDNESKGRDFNCWVILQRDIEVHIYVMLVDNTITYTHSSSTSLIADICGPAVNFSCCVRRRVQASVIVHKQHIDISQKEYIVEKYEG